MQIAEKARQYCPVFTGFLRSSIFAQKEGNQVSVGAEARYAAFVNFGTSKMPARPFLSRAVFEVMQQSEGQAQDRMANP